MDILPKAHTSYWTFLFYFSLSRVKCQRRNRDKVWYFVNVIDAHLPVIYRKEYFINVWPQCGVKFFFLNKIT